MLLPREFERVQKVYLCNRLGKLASFISLLFLPVGESSKKFARNVIEDASLCLHTIVSLCVECHFAVVHLEVFRLVCKAFTCDHYSLVFRWLQNFTFTCDQYSLVFRRLQNFTCDHYWQPHIQLLQSAGQVCVKCCSKAKSHFQLILANPKVKKRLQFFVEFLSFKSITNGY